jgi:hypothetical protein
MVKTKKEEPRIKKPFRLTAIALISIVILSILSSFFSYLGLFIFSTLLSILVFAGIILTFAGFYYLGKKHQNKLLTKTIITGFVLFIGLFIITPYYSHHYNDRFIELNETISIRESNLQQLKTENTSQEILESYEKETLEYVLDNGLPLIIPFLIIYLIHAIYLTFFGIGIIKLKKVKYSKTIGILTIISIWLIPTIIGILLTIPLISVSYILTILMFFDESKKSKE